MFNFSSRCFGAGLTVALLLTSAVAQADSLADVKKSGELSAAMSGAYPPFNFIDSTTNKVVGFDASIAEAIAERLGVKAKIVTTAWDGFIAGLLASKYDSIVGSMTITPEREKAVDFVGPYYHAGRGVFVADGSAIKSLGDIKGKTVGVTLGETHEKWARQQEGWTIKTYKGLPELLLELKTGRVDAIIADNVAVLVAAKNSGDKVAQLATPGIEGGSVGIGIAIRKDNPELKAAMQKALDDIMKDGTYEKISQKWIGRDIR